MPENFATEWYSAGQIVFREGDAGDRAYLISSGRVRVESSVGGETTLLAEFGANEIIGEMALIDDAPRSATVIASTETELVPVTRAFISERLSTTDSLTRLLLDSLLSRLRRANRMLSGAGAGDAMVPARILDPILEEIQLSNTIEHMIRDDAIGLHYQPIVDTHTLEIAGFEALFRTRDPLPRGLSIQQLIDYAERTGLVMRLGLRVLEMGHEALARFRERTGTPIFVSINVSATQLEHPSHVESLVQSIQSGVASGLKLELTETALLDSPESSARTLRKLKQAGATIALDDFGTGYSSLGYLDKFPLDTLKIDRTFIRRLDEHKSSQRIVRAIVSLAQELELNTVAEGVETELQLRVLKDIGCDYVQGFLVSRPLPAEKALEWLDR